MKNEELGGARVFMKGTVVDGAEGTHPGALRGAAGGWTLERYFRKAPEHARWEFAYGEVVVYSPASAEHPDEVGFLYSLLRGYCEAKGWGKALMGPAAVRLSLEVVRGRTCSW